MQQSEQIDQLATALAAVQKELTPVPRGAENPFFRSKYAPLEACVKHASPILTKHGLAIASLGAEEASDGECKVSTLLMHKSGQWIKGTMTVKPTKNDPQGYGSGLTYLRRYGYCAIIQLPTEGEDDDANAASEPAHVSSSPKAETPPSKEAVAQFLTWLADNVIPVAFVMARLKEIGFADDGMEAINDLPAGTLARLTAPKMQEKIKHGWETLDAKAKDAYMHGEKPPAAPKETIRTNEGNQSGERLPANGMNLQDAALMLVNAGFDSWGDVPVHFGKNQGKKLRDLDKRSLSFYLNKWQPQPNPRTGKISDKDYQLDAACCIGKAELRDKGND